MIYTAGCVMAFFLLALLLGKREKTPADGFLGAWLGLMGIQLGLFAMFKTESLYDYPALLGTGFTMPLLLAPLYYLYVLSVTATGPLAARHGLHLLAYPVANLFYLEYYLLPAQEKIAVYVNRGAGYETLVVVTNLAVMLSGLVYLGLSLWRIRTFRATLRDRFSAVERIGLDWLRNLTIGMACTWAVIIAGGPDSYIYASAVGMLLVLGYFGVRQPGIFISPTHSLSVERGPSPSPAGGQTDSTPAPPRTEEVTASARYGSSTLSEALATHVYERLTRAMRDDHLYRRPTLTLSDLAAHLGVHDHVVSEVINTRVGCTFYALVNDWRVRDFQAKAGDAAYAHLSLLGIALECGFNSKSSFNRNFAAYTGLTPTAYLARERSRGVGAVPHDGDLAGE